MSAESQIANGATSTAAATGALGSGLTFAGYLETNASIIILCCTVLSLIVGLTFHIINSRINNNRLEAQKAKLIGDWLEDGKNHDEIKHLLKLAREM